MQRQTAKAAYKLRVRQALKEEKISYSNETETETALFSNNLHNMIIKQDI